MPGPNRGLIPPAILYLNPGITKEDFVVLLDGTRTGRGNPYFESFDTWKEAPWDYVGEEDGLFHSGLRGLAKILNIESTDGIPDWDKGRGTFNDKVLFSLRDGRNKWIWEQKDGKYYLDLSQAYGCAHFPKEPFPGVGTPEWEDYRETGELPPRFKAQSGYTDLVVTAEALMMGTWKVFEYKGYLPERAHFFIDSFPPVTNLYKRALWDGSTSDYARVHNMSVHEFLRYRTELRSGKGLLPPAGEKDYS